MLLKRGPARRRSLAKIVMALQDKASGEMAEWLKAHAWKACVRETVPWVRIPLSPPAHCSLLYPIVRTDSKTTSSATKAVAASSAMLPVVTAQTVAFGRGFGGRISQRRNIVAGKLKPLDVERETRPGQYLMA